jgi:hypothetical protein
MIASLFTNANLRIFSSFSPQWHGKIAGASKKHTLTAAFPAASSVPEAEIPR